MSKKPFYFKFRVWHIPQVPGEAFAVEVRDFAEAQRIQTTLADYDAFQFKNNIKPDYSNASGIQIYQHDLTDQDLAEMGLEDRWVDIGDVDELNEYVEHLQTKGWDV